MEIKHIEKEDDFAKEVLSHEQPVLVDFYANWCGPCRILAPILEEVNKEVGTKVKIVKVDVDQAEAIARRYGVMSIPTMVLIKNGEEQDKMIGLRQKQQIIEAIQKIISK